MRAGTANEILSDIDAVRGRTRRALHPIWFANLVTGVFFVGATIVSAVASGPTAPIVYLAVGIPVGLGLIVAHAVRVERELGAEARALDPSLGVVAAIFGGIAVVNALTSGDLRRVAWMYPVAIGWTIMAWLYRHPPLAVIAVALAVVAAALAIAAPADAGLWGQLALGVLLVAAGLYGRWRARS
ncbi:MAG TPA: hypothetical protein VNZ62_10560 [Capillimicrobium sp.]|nr:hypothetical protein [Capillimicrobium sp.]